MTSFHQKDYKACVCRDFYRKTIWNKELSKNVAKRLNEKTKLEILGEELKQRQYL